MANVKLLGNTYVPMISSWQHLPRNRYKTESLPLKPQRVVTTCEAPGNATVDGWIPAPVDRWLIPLFSGFHTSQVIQDFFHQQYECDVGSTPPSQDNSHHQMITLQGINVSHLGKRKIIFKRALVGDTLVSRRVYTFFSRESPSKPLLAARSRSKWENCSGNVLSHQRGKRTRSSFRSSFWWL